MSWLARSLANSLRPDHRDGDEADDDEGEVRRIGEKGSDEAEGGESSPIEEPGSPGRGVKEDLSELTKTLTRQFWGVASFLAPPPPNVSSSSSKDSDELEVPESPRIGGIRSDFAEIGGRFRTGISRLSSNKAVSEISKIASTFLPFGSEEEEYDEEEEEDEEYEEKYDARAIGVTDEVLAFARNISMHPETWLDFPLFHEDEDSDDFDVSDAQQEHALAVERLAPRLAALRIELCPSHMSEGCFWKIYFVLLHSRLNRNDAELLSTPQVVEARTIWLQELQKRTKPESERYIRGASYGKEAVTSFQPEEQVRTPLNIPYETGPPKVVAFDERNDIPMTDFVSEKHAILSSELKMIDKSVIEEEPLVQAKNKDLPVDASEISIQRYEEEGDDWLEEETGEMGGSGNGSVPFGNEEDVSFSDLEEDDDQSAPTSSKTVNRTTNSQTKDSRGWVQLNKSSGDSAKAGNTTSPDIKESNDWLNVDDIDVV